MAHAKRQPSSSATQPKGRPTPSRTDAVSIRRDTVTVQWLAVGLVVAGAVAGLVYFGGEWGGQPTHGGTGSDVAPPIEPAALRDGV